MLSRQKYSINSFRNKTIKSESVQTNHQWIFIIKSGMDTLSAMVLIFSYYNTILNVPTHKYSYRKFNSLRASKNYIHEVPKVLYKLKWMNILNRNKSFYVLFITLRLVHLPIHVFVASFLLLKNL